MPGQPAIALPFSEWPQRDRANWANAVAPRRSRFQRQPAPAAADLRPATVRKAQLGYGIWLGFLARRGELDPGAPPASRATPERLDDWLADMRARGNRDTTILGRYRELGSALRLIEPGCDVARITRPHDTPLRRWLTPSPQTVTLVSVSDLLTRIEALFQAGIQGSSYAQGSTAVRDAAILGILATRAPRIGSLARMELGRQLQRTGDGFEVVFESEDTKTGMPLAWPLPERIAPILRHYLDIVRPKLNGSARTPSVWVGTRGHPMNERAISKIVRRRTAEWFDTPRGPHWFRKCLTTWAAEEVPEHAFDASAVLGHSPAIAIAHYNKATARAAARRHGERLRALRRKSASLARAILGNSEALAGAGRWPVGQP